MTDFTATLKSKVYIGTTKAATSVADYDSDTWTQITGVNDMGALKSSAEEIKFETIEDGIVHKQKGAVDYGNLELVVGRKAKDPGQLALRAAFKSSDAFNFKIVLNDAPAGGTPTEKFFKALVTEGGTDMKGSKDVVTESFALGVTTEILEVPAAP